MLSSSIPFSFVRTSVFVIAGGHIFGPAHSKPPFTKPVHVLATGIALSKGL